MATSTLRQRVRSAFTEDLVDQEQLKDYLSELRGNWRQADQAISRIVTLIILSGAVFELVTRGRVAEVSLGVLKLTNALPLIELAVPVIVAYLTYNMTMLWVDIQLCQHAHREIMEFRFPHLYEEDMEVLLEPPAGLNFGSRLSFFSGRSAGLADLGIGTVRVSTILLFPAAFLVYAYIRLFMVIGFLQPLLYVSLVISAFLFLVSLPNMVTAATMPD